MSKQRIHLFEQCWCGSGHDWEKAKHGTVDGRTEAEIEAEIEAALRTKRVTPDEDP